MRVYWHRLFGLMLMDYLSNRGFRVEMEKDLSLKRQLRELPQGAWKEPGKGG